MVVLGDSLSAGLGLPASAAFPERLQKALKANGIVVDMINAGVSGDTSSGGRDRLDWSVPEGTEAVISNSAPTMPCAASIPRSPATALSDILTRLKARKIAVLLCGMVAPPNYGSDYSARFNAIYPDLAKSFGVPLYPFFLEGVAADAKAQSGGRLASDGGGRRCDRQEYSAHSAGISRPDIRATQLKSGQQ